VNRPDVTVVHRREYLASRSRATSTAGLPDPVPPGSRAQQECRSLDIGVTLAAAAAEIDGQPAAAIDARIDVAALRFTVRDGIHYGRVDFAIVPWTRQGRSWDRRTRSRRAPRVPGAGLNIVRKVGIPTRSPCGSGGYAHHSAHRVRLRGRRARQCPRPAEIGRSARRERPGTLGTDARSHQTAAHRRPGAAVPGDPAAGSRATRSRCRPACGCVRQPPSTATDTCAGSGRERAVCRQATRSSAAKALMPLVVPWRACRRARPDAPAWSCWFDRFHDLLRPVSAAV